MDATERGEKLVRIETIVTGLKDTIDKQEDDRKEREEKHEKCHEKIDEKLKLHGKWFDRVLWLGGIVFVFMFPVFYFGVRAWMIQ